MRIAKYMAEAGIASRRKSEELILAGRVTLNGKTVDTPAVNVDPESDVVAVDGKKIKSAEKKVYLMLNKPVGYVSTCSDDKGRNTVLDLLEGVKERVFPVGRLDFTTEGLLLMTNDGELAYKLTHPKNEVEKCYFAVTDSSLSESDIKNIERGVFLPDGKTAPAKMHVTKNIPGRAEFTVTIHEGRNRQVRRMFEAIDKNIVFLKRIAEGPLALGDLKKGQYRELTPEEVKALMES